jgi:hypothetical protein
MIIGISSTPASPGVSHWQTGSSLVPAASQLDISHYVNKFRLNTRLRFMTRSAMNSCLTWRTALANLNYTASEGQRTDSHAKMPAGRPVPGVSFAAVATGGQCARASNAAFRRAPARAGPA